MKSKFAISAAIAAGLGLLVVADSTRAQENAGKDSELRSWTSSSGTEIEAALVSASADKITLKTKKGRVITVHPDQLSADDRKWIAEQAPKPSPSDASDDDLKRLTEILEKGLTSNPSEEERTEAEGILAALLPKEGAKGEPVEWEVRFPASGDTEERTSILITADMMPKGNDDRLIWMHVVLQKKAPESYGIEKLGRFPVMRAENRHLFLLAGRTEVRAVADHESYESDAKLDAIVKAIDLEAIKKL